MGQIYNPNDFLCQVCAYKTCLLENKGRQIIRKKVKQMKSNEEKANKTNCENIDISKE